MEGLRGRVSSANWHHPFFYFMGSLRVSASYYLFWHLLLCLKKNQNAPRASEHPPVREKNVKTFRWDHRLQMQNLFMALLFFVVFRFFLFAVFALFFLLMLSLELCRCSFDLFLSSRPRINSTGLATVYITGHG